MGKTRPPDKVKLSKRNKKLLAQKRAKEQIDPTQLLLQATTLLQTGEPDSALTPATAALAILISQHGDKATELLPALNILGEINLELGEEHIEAARTYFTQAATIDPLGAIPEDQGGGPEKFLWLAQLSEEGGEDSVKWFTKGATTLRNQIAALQTSNAQHAEEIAERRDRLASALCGIAEVYMTDLSFDDEEAETRCNEVMAEALALTPDNPETLQTLASVRISQAKRDEARTYLTKSLGLWKDLHPMDERVPPFPTRISLARLLMEAEMEEESIEVLERLIQEDDHSVEAWYLGGLCLNLLVQKRDSSVGDDEDTKSMLKRARQWLLQCLKLAQALEYEDDRLIEHAGELVAEMNGVLGEPMEDEVNEEDEWEDEDDDGQDEEMDGT